MRDENSARKYDSSHFRHMDHRNSREKTVGLKHIGWDKFSSIPILHWYLHPNLFFCAAASSA
jgi:hypothetical protein